MSEVISKIPDKLEPSEEEFELVEAEAESSELSNSGQLFGQPHNVGPNHFEEFQ